MKKIDEKLRGAAKELKGEAVYIGEDGEKGNFDIICKNCDTSTKAFILTENDIQQQIDSVVEKERKRISELVENMYDQSTDWDALKKILSIINKKQ